ncbi:hypothetical protein B0J14DRAFT_686580 [Halenospora varia]|nr:hypothetical protein B0J14DRAFT_686580 [Halenospora varia]
MEKLYADLDSAISESQRTTYTEPRICLNESCTFPYGSACEECSRAFAQHHERREAEKEARTWKWIRDKPSLPSIYPTSSNRVQNGRPLQRSLSWSSSGSITPRASPKCSLQSINETGKAINSASWASSSKSSFTSTPQSSTGGSPLGTSIEAVRTRSAKWLPSPQSSNETSTSSKSTQSLQSNLGRPLIERSRSDSRGSPVSSSPLRESSQFTQEPSNSSRSNSAHSEATVTSASSSRREARRAKAAGEQSSALYSGRSGGKLTSPTSTPQPPSETNFYSSASRANSTGSFRATRLDNYVSDVFDHTLNGQVNGPNFNGGADAVNTRTDLCPLCYKPLGDPRDQHLLRCTYAHEEKVREEQAVKRMVERNRRRNE